MFVITEWSCVTTEFVKADSVTTEFDTTEFVTTEFVTTEFVKTALPSSSFVTNQFLNDSKLTGPWQKFRQSLELSAGERRRGMKRRIFPSFPEISILTIFHQANYIILIFQFFSDVNRYLKYKFNWEGNKWLSFEHFAWIASFRNLLFGIWFKNNVEFCTLKQISKFVILSFSKHELVFISLSLNPWSG